MKKLFVGILAAALAISACTVSVSAAGAGYGKNFGKGYTDKTNGVCNYLRPKIDADEDGICDLRGTTGNGIGYGFVDEDNDGICDNRDAATNCNGYGFVDEDGDGICDNRGTAGNGGAGYGFVDNDGDGVCDYGTGTRPQDGSGLKKGFRGGRS